MKTPHCPSSSGPFGGPLGPFSPKHSRLLPVVRLFLGVLMVQMALPSLSWGEPNLVRIRSNVVNALKTSLEPAGSVVIELGKAQVELEDQTAGVVVPKLNNVSIEVIGLPAPCLDLVKTAFSASLVQVKLEIAGTLLASNYLALVPRFTLQGGATQCSLRRLNSYE